VTQPYDAVLLVSFGGPERPGDVVPFLENVTRGVKVPEARILEVAKRYDRFEGVSPANAENRALLAALVTELNTCGPRLPVYWGNRNWHPLLTDTLRQMADDGVGRALAFVTSAFGSYSGCRQYLSDVEEARQAVGSNAPEIDKLRLFYNHPGFIEPMRDRVAAALAELPAERRAGARVIYTTHSLPVAMAEKCDYREQLEEACRLVSESLEHCDGQLAYQSRSGPPRQPWLEPDLADLLRELAKGGEVADVVIAPIGFLYEHMEIVYDLDVQIAELCDRLGLNMVRASVVGPDPRFVTMIRELILERIEPEPTRLALGTHGPSHDVCPPDCCGRS
jgi:ferrochelatase